jgi:hypothetical protein
MFPLCLFFSLWSTAARAGAASNKVEASDALYWAHQSALAFGFLFAMILAGAAFARPEAVNNVPTFPKYMTSRRQYRLGAFIFISIATFFFYVMVNLHKEVIQLALLIKPDIEGLKQLKEALADGEVPGLVVVCAISAIYMYLLHTEGEWNVLLAFRNLIRQWINIPRLVNDLVGRISSSLEVPATSIREIVEASRNSNLVAPDFQKARGTPDRIWAELSYMKRWLEKKEVAGADTTFFKDKSFLYQETLKLYREKAIVFRGIKSGLSSLSPEDSADLLSDLNSLRNDFSRIVACYIVYRNGNEDDLIKEAKTFGLPYENAPVLNPLRYILIYLISVVLSVYLGVYASAIVFDIYSGSSILDAFAAQDPDLVQKWIVLSLSNYGFAIAGVLAVRFVFWEKTGEPSFITTYAWSFFVAAFLGPVGLTAAVEFYHPEVSLLVTLKNMLQWGIGPGVIAVYVSYFLDRQTSSALPDVVHSHNSIVTRIETSFWFALLTIIIQLPPLLSFKPYSASAWSNPKLHFVAAGTTFLLTLSLGIVAQFGLRKPTRLSAPPHTPGSSPGSRAEIENLASNLDAQGHA